MLFWTNRLCINLGIAMGSFYWMGIEGNESLKVDKQN